MQNEALMPFLLKYGLLDTENSVSIEKLAPMLPEAFRAYIQAYGTTSIELDSLEAIMANPPMESLSYIEQEIAALEKQNSEYFFKLEASSAQCNGIEARLQALLSCETDCCDAVALENYIVERISAYVTYNCIALYKGFAQVQQTQSFNEQMEYLLLLKQSVIALNQTLYRDALQNDAVSENGFQKVSEVAEQQRILTSLYLTLTQRILRDDVWICIFCMFLVAFAFLAVW